MRSDVVRRAPTVALFFVALVCTPDCAFERDEPPPVDLDDATGGAIVSAATWTLEWNTEGLELDPEGGWSVTTNLGYRVHVDRGFFVTHNVSLVPCPPEESTTAWLGWSVRSASAHEENADPSMIEALLVSDLAHPRTAAIGESSFPPTRYCKVFWLVARGMPGKQSPDGLDLSNRSIFLAGTWERGGSSGIVDIDTWWPQGKLVDLDVPAAEDEAVRFAFITIESPLGRAFDDVDFEFDSEAVMEDRILDNLSTGAVARVELATP